MLVVFSAGVCGALLVRHPAGAFLATLLVGSAFVLAATIPLAAHLRDDANLSRFEPAALLATTLTVLFLLAVSAITFVKGEVASIRGLPGRVAIVTGAVLILALSSDLIARGWRSRSTYIVIDPTVSPNREHLGIFEVSETWRTGRLRIADLKGRSMAANVGGDFTDMTWSSDGTLLTISGSSALVHLFIGDRSTPWLERRRADGTLLERLVLPRGRVSLLYAGDLPMLVIEDPREGRCTIATLTLQGRIQQLLAFACEHGPSIAARGNAMIARFNSPDGTRVVKVANGIKELPWAERRRTKDDRIFAVDERLYASTRSAARALHEIAPLDTLDAAPGQRRAYVCDGMGYRWTWSEVCSFGPIDAIVWQGSLTGIAGQPIVGSMHRFDPATRTWVLIESRARLEWGEAEPPMDDIVVRPRTVRWLENGRLAWIRMDSEGRSIGVVDGKPLAVFPNGKHVFLIRERDLVYYQPRPRRLREDVEALGLEDGVTATTQRARFLFDSRTGSVVGSRWLRRDRWSPSPFLTNADGSTLSLEFERSAPLLVTRSVDGEVISSVPLSSK